MKFDIWEQQNKETCNLTLEAHKIASLKSWYFNEYLIILLSKNFYPFYNIKNTKTVLRQMDIYGSTLKGVRLQVNANRFDTSFIIQLPHSQWQLSRSFLNSIENFLDRWKNTHKCDECSGQQARLYIYILLHVLTEDFQVWSHFWWPQSGNLHFPTFYKRHN